MFNPTEIAQVNPVELRKQQLATLPESRPEGESVAMFGTSIEFVAEFLIKGAFVYPSYREQRAVDYQQQLIAQGKYIYYAYGDGAGVDKFKPELRSEIEQGFISEYNVSDDVTRLVYSSQMDWTQHVDESLDSDKNIKSSKHYAITTALEDYFIAQTGVVLDYSSIVQIAAQYDPESAKLLKKELDIYPREDFYEVYDSLKEKVGDELLAAVAQEAIKRRGVIIFLNKGIFSFDVKPSPEGAEHLIIIGDKPMGIEQVAAIQYLSEFDKEAIKVAA